MNKLVMLLFLAVSLPALATDNLSSDVIDKLEALFNESYTDFYQNESKSENLSYSYCYRNARKFIEMFTTRLKNNGYQSKDISSVFRRLGLRVHYYNRTVAGKEMDCDDVNKRFYFYDQDKATKEQYWGNHVYLVKYANDDQTTLPKVYDPLFERALDFTTYYYNIETFEYKDDMEKIQIVEFMLEDFDRLCRSFSYEALKTPSTYLQFNPHFIFISPGSPVTFTRFSIAKQ